MNGPILTIHGHPVLAFIQTEVQSTGPCGYVLVQTKKKVEGSKDIHEFFEEYVTAWYRLGDHEWSTGHYFGEYNVALNDLWLRACRSIGVK